MGRSKSKKPTNPLHNILLVCGIITALTGATNGIFKVIDNIEARSKRRIMADVSVIDAEDTTSLGLAMVAQPVEEVEITRPDEDSVSMTMRSRPRKRSTISRIIQPLWYIAKTVKHTWWMFGSILGLTMVLAFMLLRIDYQKKNKR